MCLNNILYLFLLSSSISLAQSVSLGFKLESLGYFYKNNVNNISELSIIPIPISGYVKASIVLYDKYEIELKGGVQLDEKFAGPEYAIVLKYKLWRNIFPLITYLKHFNAGDSRTGGGTYSNKIEFLGAGMEARLTKVFGVDLIYFIPIGGKELEYLIDINSVDLSLEKITTTKMVSMIKLGFIFNINL